jgi:hypothetical protein
MTKKNRTIWPQVVGSVLAIVIVTMASTGEHDATVNPKNPTWCVSLQVPRS